MTRAPVLVLIGRPAWVEAVRRGVPVDCTVIEYTERQGYVPRLADDNAALVLVDGDTPEWSFWVTAAKTNNATRRIPIVVAAGSPEAQAEARLSGADLTLAPGTLLDTLDDVLARFARGMDRDQTAALDRQCGEPLPEEAREALALFNRGEYYRQHDAFEALWMRETGPVRELYRGVLQVGVAYHQITRGNGRGALKLLLRSLQWLDPLPDVCRGIDVRRLRDDAAAVRAELERLGPERVAELDLSLLRPVRLVDGQGQERSP